jgi:hypothetical protein
VRKGLFALSMLLLLSASWPMAAQESASRRIAIELRREGMQERAWLLMPFGLQRDGSVRVIVALHGLGEARRGPVEGALGWLDDYALERAFGALARGHVEGRDVNNWASVAQLRAMTRRLQAQPFRDVAVLMPYTPDLARETPGSEAIVRYGRWITNELLPAARREVPALSHEARDWAIDGVSLGGMLALDIGLRHPDVFGSVGGIQPAVRSHVDAFGALATTSTRCLRIASSAEDPFLRATRGLSRAWTRRHIRHELVEYQGTHSYTFNRGPGSVELLRFHHACFSAPR